MRKPLKVTVYDPESDTTDTKEIPAGDYLLIVDEPLYLDTTQVYANGTQILTIKKRGRDA